jgi:hypothetical protein
MNAAASGAQPDTYTRNGAPKTRIRLCYNLRISECCIHLLAYARARKSPFSQKTAPRIVIFAYENCPRCWTHVTQTGSASVQHLSFVQRTDAVLLRYTRDEIGRRCIHPAPAITLRRERPHNTPAVGARAPVGSIAANSGRANGRRQAKTRWSGLATIQGVRALRDSVPGAAGVSD